MEDQVITVKLMLTVVIMENVVVIKDGILGKLYLA
jgi:hypothetical protein